MQAPLKRSLLGRTLDQSTTFAVLKRSLVRIRCETYKVKSLDRLPAHGQQPHELPHADKHFLFFSLQKYLSFCYVYDPGLLPFFWLADARGWLGRIKCLLANSCPLGGGPHPAAVPTRGLPRFPQVSLEGLTNKIRPIRICYPPQ